MNRLRRWKRNCCLILLAGVLLLILLCAALLMLVYRVQAQTAEPLPLGVLLLIDHSNSMWDRDGVGSDPELLRIQAANLFVAYLGLDTARPGSRLGVVHFGGRSELVVPLTPLDDAGHRQAIRTAIANPRRMDWTDPLQALQLAYDTLFPSGQRDPTRQPVVILLTDGKPELSSTSSAAQRTAYVADLRALVERFRERGCPIFTIALSNTATDADPDIQTVYRNLWQEIAARTPPAEYHEARAAADLLHIYHAAVARLAGAQANAPIIEAAVDEHTTRTLVVEDGLAQVTLVVLRSDPALEVRLLRPGGAPARPHDPDVRRTGEPGTTREEVWTITDPRPGRWRLDLRGNGTVVVWQDTVSRRDSHPPAYAIDMAALPTYVPAGRSLDMAGISVRQVSTGRPVTGVGLRVVAELRRAGFAEATLLARDDGQGCDIEAGDGDYCATLPDPPPGACVLLMRGLLDGHEVARRQVAFEAIPLPALEVLSPRPRSSLEPSAPISVEVRVWAGERPLGEKELAAQGTLTASLRSAGLDAAVPLAEAGGIFAGSFVAPDSPGPLTLTVRLRGHTAEGLPFEDAARASLAVAAPDVQEGAGRSGPGWILPLAGLVGLAALGSVGGLLMRQRRGRVTLDGGLRVLEAPPGQPTGAVLDLPAASSVVLGGTGKGAVPLHEASSRVILRAGRAPEGDVETWIAPLAGEDDSAVALNGRPLDRARRLGDGDVLTLGTYRLRYESLRQASAQRARRRPRRRMDVMGGMR